MQNAVRQAREILAQVTPLLRDCGRICGARCCTSLEGEETGMLLFPGEEAFYDGRPGWIIRSAAQGKLLLCSGRCERQERPLSCRLFPLLPLLKGTEVSVMTDERARAVCPLARQGRSAMNPQFVEAVRAAGQALAREEEQAAFLKCLAAEQAEWKRIRREWGKADG